MAKAFGIWKISLQGGRMLTYRIMGLQKQEKQASFLPGTGIHLI
jgi:hypothetical protein